MEIRSDCSYRCHLTLFRYCSQPDLHQQHRFGWNEPRHAFVPTGQMRTDTNLTLTADFHAYLRMFHASNYLAVT